MHISDLNEELDKAVNRGMRQSLAERIRRLLDSLEIRPPEDDADQIWGDLWDSVEQHARSGHINMIPGEDLVPCAELCVALSHSEGQRLRGIRLPKQEVAMRRVRSHLIQCADRCEAVIFFTDEWRSRHFAESRLDLEAHESKGRWLFPILVNGDKRFAMSWKN